MSHQDNLRALARLRDVVPLHNNADVEAVWLNEAVDELDRLTYELAVAKEELALTEQQVADAMATINTLGFSKDGLIKERDAMKVDAERYRWWRENIDEVSKDEAGISGVAFSFQMPISRMTTATDGEMMDFVADAAIDAATGSKA